MVNYRAGPEGYTVTGDTGADEEGLRAQRQLYATDRSYLVQQQVWQALAAGRPIDAILASAAGGSSSSSASSAASAAAASSSSSNSDWTSVSGGGGGGAEQLSGDYYTTKGGINRFAERYTALKSPSSALRETSTSSVNSQRSSSSSSSASSSASSSSSVSGYSSVPAVATKTVETTSSRYVQPSHYSSTVYHTTKSAPLVQQSHSYWYNSPYTSYQVVQPSARLVTTKTVHQQPARLVQTTKTVQQQPVVSARIVETTKTVQQPISSYQTTVIQSPAAKLVQLNQGSSSSSSSSSALASASASASASSSSSSGAYTSGVKGYSGAIKTAPIRSGRYVVVPTGGRTVVNFSQGGPQPYKYSYAFK